MESIGKLNSLDGVLSSEEEIWEFWCVLIEEKHKNAWMWLELWSESNRN